MSKESASSSGIGLGGVLFVLFTGLKLGHVINWSWWWVTSPLWLPAAVVLFVIFLIVVLVGLFQ